MAALPGPPQSVRRGGRSIAPILRAAAGPSKCPGPSLRLSPLSQGGATPGGPDPGPVEGRRMNAKSRRLQLI